MVLKDIIDSMQRSINHHHLFGPLRPSDPLFFNNWGLRKFMAVKIVNVRIRSIQRTLPRKETSQRAHIPECHHRAAAQLTLHRKIELHHLQVPVVWIDSADRVNRRPLGQIRRGYHGREAIRQAVFRNGVDVDGNVHLKAEGRLAELAAPSPAE